MRLRTFCFKLLLAASVLALLGCAQLYEGRAALKLTDSRRAIDVFKFRRDSLNPSARYFLLAGSARNANFAQEVVDQYRHWHGLGVPQEEIACYYVRLLQEQYLADLVQFNELAPELAKCFPADAKRFRADLIAAAAKNSDFVYLYITSHGLRPVSDELTELDRSSEYYWQRTREAAYPEFDQYRVEIESLPDGPATESERIGALRAGLSARDILLTPSYLREGLERFKPETRKFVILQACFGGGFIADSRFERRGLSALSNTTILTSARNDRESFGPEFPGRRSFYGAAVLEALKKRPGLPVEVHWQSVHMQASREVAQREEREDLLPSLPQYSSLAK